MFTLATKFVPERFSFETATASGFRAAEFWLDSNLLAKGEEIAVIASEFPFRYALHFPNEGPISNENLRSTATLYQRLKCTAIVIHQPMFDRYGSTLREIASGLDLAIENHRLDQAGFDHWADRNPGLTLDVEHLWKFTLDDAPLATLLEHVEQFLKRHSHKLHHIHLPGYLPGGEEHLPIQTSDEMAREVLTRLAEYGFEKLVVSEADSQFQTVDSLKESMKWYESWRELSKAKN